MKINRRKTWGAALLAGALMWGAGFAGATLARQYAATETVRPAGYVAPVASQPEPEPTELAVRPPIPGLPECPTEDSVGPCNWYGGENGEGLKFAAIPEPGQPVPADMAEFLAEEDPARDWSVCTWYVGDTSYVVCPDGFSVSS
jgi:hypothetical protein